MGLSTDLPTISTENGDKDTNIMNKMLIYYRRKLKSFMCVRFCYPQVWIVLWITKDCLLFVREKDYAK